MVAYQAVGVFGAMGLVVAAAAGGHFVFPGHVRTKIVVGHMAFFALQLVLSSLFLEGGIDGKMTAGAILEGILLHIPPVDVGGGR